MHFAVSIVLGLILAGILLYFIDKYMNKGVEDYKEDPVGFQLQGSADTLEAVGLLAGKHSVLDESPIHEDAPVFDTLTMAQAPVPTPRPSGTIAPAVRSVGSKPLTGTPAPAPRQPDSGKSDFEKWAKAQNKQADEETKRDYEIKMQTASEQFEKDYRVWLGGREDLTMNRKQYYDLQVKQLEQAKSDFEENGYKNWLDTHGDMDESVKVKAWQDFRLNKLMEFSDRAALLKRLQTSWLK
jgi:hypothetical protein